MVGARPFIYTATTIVNASFLIRMKYHYKELLHLNTDIDLNVDVDVALTANRGTSNVAPRYAVPRRTRFSVHIFRTLPIGRNCAIAGRDNRSIVSSVLTTLCTPRNPPKAYSVSQKPTFADNASKVRRKCTRRLPNPYESRYDCNV